MQASSCRLNNTIAIIDAHSDTCFDVIVVGCVGCPYFCRSSRGECVVADRHGNKLLQQTAKGEWVSAEMVCVWGWGGGGGGVSQS